MELFHEMRKLFPLDGYNMQSMLSACAVAARWGWLSKFFRGSTASHLCARCRGCRDSSPWDQVQVMALITPFGMFRLILCCWFRFKNHRFLLFAPFNSSLCAFDTSMLDSLSFNGLLENVLTCVGWYVVLYLWRQSGIWVWWWLILFQFFEITLNYQIFVQWVADAILVIKMEWSIHRVGNVHLRRNTCKHQINKGIWAQSILKCSPF